MSEIMPVATVSRGVFGQLIYIDPGSELVVVKLSTWPTFLDTNRGLNIYRMVEAIAAHLTQNVSSTEIEGPMAAVWP